MTPIFIDSCPLRAIHNPKDQYYNLAVRKFAKIRHRNLAFVTTDYIIDEVYTGLLIGASYRNTMELDKTLSQSDFMMERVSASRFTMAQIVFRRFSKDKIWSFTDCTSYVVMKELKIKQVFAFDDHFSQMGFDLF